jgi:hypothetical protein
MKATFFCSAQPHCNGQMYYCADCCDNHDHKSVVISKKVREFGTEWKKLIEEIAHVAGKAS